jgi:lipoprotein-anchoring transpeptidase ErfK/SrfK
MRNLRRHKVFIAYCIAVVVFVVAALFLWASPLAQKSVPNTLPGTSATSTSGGQAAPQTEFHKYIEITDSCGPYYEGICVNLRSGPGTEYPVVTQLRNGMVLKVASTTIDADGHTWYKIGFDGPIRYPERVTSDWYVAADYVQLFMDPGVVETTAGINASSTKRIVVDIANETLYAYDGDTLFMQQPISSGLELTPTSLGTFWVYRKIPDSYMQGPIPGLSDQYYDLPGVPWDLYFTMGGSAIHGAYWHNHFGEPWSHGCVNLSPENAKLLYAWADLGTPVIVQD